MINCKLTCLWKVNKENSTGDNVINNWNCSCYCAAALRRIMLQSHCRVQKNWTLNTHTHTHTHIYMNTHTYTHTHTHSVVLGPGVKLISPHNSHSRLPTLNSKSLTLSLLSVAGLKRKCVWEKVREWERERERVGEQEKKTQESAQKAEVETESDRER